jgi:hypothetical protein
MHSRPAGSQLVAAAGLALLSIGLPSTPALAESCRSVASSCRGEDVGDKMVKLTGGQAECMKLAEPQKVKKPEIEKAR